MSHCQFCGGIMTLDGCDTCHVKPKKKEKPKIGCAVFTMIGGKIVCVSGEGRGHTLPGGKWEPGESFIEAAARELLEETGAVAKNYRLMFAGMSEEGYYCYTFAAEFVSAAPGAIELCEWADLLKSKFRGYYELLHEVFLQGGWL